MAENSASGFLKRLSRAVQATGLTADPAMAESEVAPILVTGRLAQAAINHMQLCSQQAAQKLALELEALTSAEDYELMVQGKGYTYLHTIQFIYEFAKHELPANPYFSAEVGRIGGGLQMESDKDIVSLVGLLVQALPVANDGENMGLLVRALGPMMLDKVFTSGILQMDVAEEGANNLQIVLRFGDRAAVGKSLEVFGMGRDSGTFFLNTALQVQGTILNGLWFMARDYRRSTSLQPLIQDREQQSREDICRECSCAWSVSWNPDIQLRRLRNPEEILARMSTVYETMHRRDLEYFKERVKTLEMRVRDLESGGKYHDLIGSSEPMRQIYELIEQVAATDLTVLIRGESGTGKELVAHAIHKSSERREGNFIPVNCAAFSDTLLESELFGHEKGAFTGAHTAKPGRFERADGGTLFLDEVGDIPLTTQVKLLRVLETQSFERVGGTQLIHADVRFIGATNRDIEDLIARGLMREDFYFRLNVLPINVPALRHHLDDIPQLAQHFLERIKRRSGKLLQGLARGAVSRLMEHSWPGNIRELQNVIERAVAVYARGATLSQKDISQALGLPLREVSSSVVNHRQREILECIVGAAAGCRIEEIMELMQPLGEDAGFSRRTLQNDLRKLAELGWVSWIKQGSAYRYQATPQGVEQVEGG